MSMLSWRGGTIISMKSRAHLKIYTIAGGAISGVASTSAASAAEEDKNELSAPLIGVILKSRGADTRAAGKWRGGKMS